MSKPLSTAELAESLESLSRNVGEDAGDIPSVMRQAANAMRRLYALQESAKTSTVAFLFDNAGREVNAPVEIEATVSWSAKDAIAQAFDRKGRLIGTLQSARIEWFDRGGIRIVGMQPISPESRAYQVQAWQVRP